MQVLNIGDVANSARNNRNAVCQGDEDVDNNYKSTKGVRLRAWRVAGRKRSQ